MVLVMVRRMILNINITNSQYNLPYHLGRTILMMMHDTDVDDNDELMMMPLMIIINTNITNSKYYTPNYLVMMIITKRIKLAHKCML